jgi:ATP-dependent DNA ligase
VVGWTDPEGSRPWLGALLLAYYDPDGKLVYSGRAGTGIKQTELERLWHGLHCNHSPPTRCRSRYRRRATAVSDRR